MFGELKQHNIIIDTLGGGGGWDEHYNALQVGTRSPEVLLDTITSFPASLQALHLNI